MDYKFTVKQARKYRNMTMDEVAKKLNISRSTYAYYENSPDMLNGKQMLQISKIFEIPVDDLIFFQ